MTHEQLAALVSDLRIKSAMIAMGEKIQWGSDTALMDQAADTIERLQVEVARLSTPPDDAETAAMVALLGGRAPFPPDAGDYDLVVDLRDAAAIADALTRLSHALAAEKAKREAMEAALQNVMGHVDTPIGRRRLHVGSPQPEWLTEARATLAKHGSK